MANRPVYCTEAAIRTHLGALKLPASISLDSCTETAANELDGLLGVRYGVPIIVSPNVSTEKVTAYWLSSVSSMIAAGRIMVATAAPGSQDATNNYGKYLLTTAFQMITSVVEKKRDLIGAVDNEQETGSDVGPQIFHGDAYSQVDLFYDNQEPCGFMPGRSPRPSNTSWPR